MAPSTPENFGADYFPRRETLASGIGRSGPGRECSYVHEYPPIIIVKSADKTGYLTEKDDVLTADYPCAFPVCNIDWVIILADQKTGELDCVDVRRAGWVTSLMSCAPIGAFALAFCVSAIALPPEVDLSSSG